MSRLRINHKGGNLSAAGRHVSQARRTETRKKSSHLSARKIGRKINKHICAFRLRSRFASGTLRDEQQYAPAPPSALPRSVRACWSAASHSRSSVSHPSVTPVPPYSSLGFRTKLSLLWRRHNRASQTIRRRASSSCPPQARPRNVAADQSRSRVLKSAEFRSSVSTAKNAFLCGILQVSALAMQTAPAS